MNEVIGGIRAGFAATIVRSAIMLMNGAAGLVPQLNMVRVRSGRWVRTPAPSA